MRRDLGREIDRYGKQTLTQNFAAALRGSKATFAGMLESPNEAPEQEFLSAPVINGTGTLKKSPLVEKSLKLVNGNTNVEYDPGIAFSEIPATGQFKNLTIPNGTYLKAYYAYRQVAPGTQAVDHGATTGLGDDDHPQYALADGSRLQIRQNRPSSPQAGQFWRVGDVIWYFDGTADRRFIADAASHTHDDLAKAIHSHDLATPGIPGFMSGPDKQALDGLLVPKTEPTAPSAPATSGGGARFATLMKLGIRGT